MWLSIRSGDTSAFQTSGREFRSRASNCALLTISVISICVLVVCGVMIVREYSLSKEYQKSICQVTNVTYDETRIGCKACSSAKKGKNKEKGTKSCWDSKFPCVHVHVSFSLHGKERTGFLHPDSLQAAGAHAQCSYSICLEKEGENVKAVKKFGDRWMDRRQSNFQCFYNDKNHKKVIAQKKHSKHQVIHAMLWPSIVIVVCGVIFLRLETQRRGIGFCTVKTLETERHNKQDGTASIEDRTAKDSLIQIKTTSHDSSAGTECKVVPKKHRHHHPEKHKHSKDSSKPPPGPPCISNSMSSLDCISKNDKTAPAIATNGKAKIGTSASEEGLKYYQVQQGEGSSGGLNGAAKYRQDSNKTDSSFGSQGSKITGQETPV